MAVACLEEGRKMDVTPRLIHFPALRYCIVASIRIDTRELGYPNISSRQY